MEKQVLWDSSSFKLFQKIEPFTSFWGNAVNVYRPEEVYVKVNTL